MITTIFGFAQELVFCVFILATIVVVGTLFTSKSR